MKFREFLNLNESVTITKTKDYEEAISTAKHISGGKYKNTIEGSELKISFETEELSNQYKIMLDDIGIEYV